MWRAEILVRCWWQCKLVHPLWKIAWKFLKKLTIEPPLWSSKIALLGVYPKKVKTLIRKDICTLMFTVVLFTIAKIWKQPVSIDRWMNKEAVAYIYNSAINKKAVFPFVTTWIDLEGIMFSEISQTKTNPVWFYLYVDSKKQNKGTNRTKEKQTHSYRE